MNVHELNADQMHELKGNYIDEKNQERCVGTSYGELADADELVSDEEIFAEYGDINFSPDDFGCTAGWPEYTCEVGAVVIPKEVAAAIDPRLNIELFTINDGMAWFELHGCTEAGRDVCHTLLIEVDDLVSIPEWRKEFFELYQDFSPWKETCMKYPFEDGDEVYEDFREYDRETLGGVYDELMRIKY